LENYNFTEKSGLNFSKSWGVLCQFFVRKFHHRQRGSDCTVLTVTGLVNGEWQILTPYRIETPKPIDKKFGTRDYVGETTPYAKFGANRSTGGFWANR